MVSHLTLGAECAVAAVEGADHPAVRRARLGGGERPLVDVVDVPDHVPQLRRDELAGRVRARERIWIYKSHSHMTSSVHTEGRILVFVLMITQKQGGCEESARLGLKCGCKFV